MFPRLVFGSEEVGRYGNGRGAGAFSAGCRADDRSVSAAGGRAYWFSFIVFRIALTLLPISWTWAESMVNKLLMRWSSAFTHSAFSSASLSCQRLFLYDFSQCFVSDMLDLFSEIILPRFFSTVCQVALSGVRRGFVARDSNLPY